MTLGNIAGIISVTCWVLAVAIPFLGPWPQVKPYGFLCGLVGFVAAAISVVAPKRVD
jgi:hypothetical protein